MPTTTSHAKSHARAGRSGMRTTGRRWQALACLVGTLVICNARTSAQELPDDDASITFFRHTIEPILRKHCLECHSHASRSMEGGLTLDSRSGWQTGGERGPAIVPGSPEKSLVVQAVRHTDANLKMPPEEMIPPVDVEHLVNWIAQGAADPRSGKPAETQDPLDWWSLRPLRAASPTDSPTSLHHNPIDDFIENRLTEKGLIPVPAADRKTLIRRLYFDLHGLPPGPDDVKAFLADDRPDAWKRLVQRLLDSPRYGERWARHWLDTVHFADSHGCEHDVFRPHAWRYRDYVIATLNRDTRWTRFVREQLAADWFYPEQTELIPALGFIAAGPLELSRAGTAPVTFDYLDRDDIVSQTMTAFASTTANCARCHYHKFDPISQEDYYALQAVFAGGGKGDVEFDDDSAIRTQRSLWNDLLAAVQANDRVRLLAPKYQDVISSGENSLGNVVQWESLKPVLWQSSEGTILTRLDDDSLLASGTPPESDVYTVTTAPQRKKITALRLDVLPHESLPATGPGRATNGNLHLSEFEAVVFDDESPEHVKLEFHQAKADFDQQGWTIAHALDGNAATAWGIHPQIGKPHQAVFELKEPLTTRPGTQIVLTIKQLHGRSHLIGRLKLHATDAPSPAIQIYPEAVQSALSVQRGVRTEDQQVAIAAYVLKQHAQDQLKELPAPASVYAWSRNFSHGKRVGSPLMPKTVHVLGRGDIHQPGKTAAPGAISAIQKLQGRFDLTDPNDEASRRAALADWLTNNNNPLTWRSAVNRVWAIHFGRGLCDTPNDFGRMGGVPSHPELLDWLAVWFRDEAKGSLKELHRIILLSAAWRRASAVSQNDLSARALSIDGENRLLWRMNARPLDAECYRDAVLQIAGRINFTMGGPGIHQFKMSAGQQLTPQLDYDAFDWENPVAARRSIYRVVWRGIADPFMESLDFPDLGLLTAGRGYSVSALQALTVYNNDFVLYHSQRLSEQLKPLEASLNDQVSEAFRRVLLRSPDQHEKEILTEYGQKHGLAAVCRILLNSNEFFFVN